MKFLILSMIFAGSGLMVYNIIRYAIFVKENKKLEKESRNAALTVVPLLLLVFFLVGYIVVGLSGIADLLIASILLGGSIFVFLLLWVMFAIISHVRDTDQILAARYEEINQEIKALTKDSLSLLRVNLTTDEIEERGGDCLYDTDYEYDTYSELIKARGKNVVDSVFNSEKRAVFERDSLIKRFQEGAENESGVFLIKRKDGVVSFVKFEVTLTKKPVSGDIVAFIVESPFNEGIVRRLLFEKVLLGEYDRIAYIIDGKYKVLISNTGKKKGLLLNDDEEDSYESIYFNSILPKMSYDKKKNDGKPNPLRLSVIENELENKDHFEVDAPFNIDGDVLYKHFVFYKVDKNAKFYLMLLSDSTSIREEHEKQNRDLSEALGAAVRANESRVNFFKNVSHNLRTPMNGIMGFAELALRENDVEAIRSYMSKIISSGNELVARLNDLFDLSLLDSKTLILENKPTDLFDLSERIVSRMKTFHPEKELSLVADTRGLKNAFVMCDASRLTRIIERLLENSTAFAPEKSEVVFSVSEEDAGENRRYVFSVKNKGLKIPREVIDRIFEPETWIGNPDVGDLNGAGIGMAVSKGLIDLMGGNTEVISENGDEVVFEVSLPLEKAASEENHEKDSSGAELGSLKLLVADDNEINREIAELILTGEGHEVDLAVNGKEAVEKISSSGKKYDAVLMDIQMPVMNGYEATSAIRALSDPELSSVPIIAMTANAYQEDRNEAKSAGMDGYVTKPIDPDELRAALSKTVKK